MYENTIFLESSSLLLRLSVNLAKFSSSYNNIRVFRYIVTYSIPVLTFLQSHFFAVQFHPSWLHEILEYSIGWFNKVYLKER